MLDYIKQVLKDIRREIREEKEGKIKKEQLGEHF
jgi:hypothetical protein